MEEQPNKYQRGKIYKLTCNKTGKNYIGSTCEKRLCQRINKHRDCYKRYKKGTYHYVSSFDIFDGEDYDSVLLEEFPCANKDQLHTRERYWKEQTENCVNRGNPISDKKYKQVLDTLYDS